MVKNARRNAFAVGLSDRRDMSVRALDASAADVPAAADGNMTDGIRSGERRREAATERPSATAVAAEADASIAPSVNTTDTIPASQSDAVSALLNDPAVASNPMVLQVLRERLRDAPASPRPEPGTKEQADEDMRRLREMAYRQHRLGVDITEENWLAIRDLSYRTGLKQKVIVNALLEYVIRDNHLDVIKPYVDRYLQLDEQRRKQRD